MKTKNILELFLKQLKVKYSKSYLNKCYEEHPDKDTLFGISDVLSRYNIKTTGYKIKSNENLNDINCPFITSIKGEFSVVSEMSNNNITYLSQNKKETISTEDFLNYWNGIVLTANINSKSIEPDYTQHKKVEIFNFLRDKAFIIAIILLFILSLISGNIYSDTGSGILLSINLTGVYIGYLLLQKQIQIQNNQADKICSLLRYGCNNILNSSAAKFLGIIGWSEVGLGYFLSNLCVLLLFPSLTPYLALINCCALPYSLWSIWYQKFVAKKWCALCLVVQILLWLLFLTNLVFGYIYFPPLSLSDILIISCLFIIPIALINISLPYLTSKEQLKAVRKEYNKMKVNKEIFKTKLKSQSYYEVDKNISSILWGNKHSKMLITIVTNPHCTPCANMHKQIDNLLNRIGDKICVQYIFSSFSEELESSAIFLTAVYLSNDMDTDRKKEIYNRWFEYGINEKDNFFKKYNLDMSAQTVLEESNRHKKWIESTQITGTPTIIINGHEFPEEYIIEDMSYFTDLDING